MPFDPKLIRDEEDAGFEGDLKLPDDLALMAEQLGDDAARLASAYPPPKPKLAKEHVAVSQRASVRASAWLTRSLAGTALAAGLVTISLVAMNAQKGAINLAPAGAPTPNSGSLAADHSRPATPQPKIPVTPASYLGETTGPELEALTDLWEQDQPAVRSLSF